MAIGIGGDTVCAKVSPEQAHITKPHNIAAACKNFISEKQVQVQVQVDRWKKPFESRTVIKGKETNAKQREFGNERLRLAGWMDGMQMR